MPMLIAWASLSWAQSADVSVLRDADDRSTLLRAALNCAASKDPAVQKELAAQLGTAAFLERLDSRADSEGPSHTLRLARVLQAMAENPAGHPGLVSLTSSPAFTTFEPREELLIRSLAAVRPAPAAAVRFWSEQSHPDSPYLHVTIAALVENGSRPALDLLEKRMADRHIDPEDKIAWMRDPILRHRTDVAVLAACERLLSRGLPAKLRAPLLEALTSFDRRWYRSEHPPVAPAWKDASSDAREVLRRICDNAVKELSLSAAQRDAIHRTLVDIGGATQ
jgi:hypothetical protein